MSSDLYLTTAGDLALTSYGDLALVETPWRDRSQQAYIRLMTAIGDFLLYPGLGADLERLIGMANTKETGEYGKKLILQSLQKEGILASLPINVNPVPVSYQSIRFDVYITVGNSTELILSIEQDLGIEDAQGELEA